jgi:hypothetical protein
MVIGPQQAMLDTLGIESSVLSPDAKRTRFRTLAAVAVNDSANTGLRAASRAARRISPDSDARNSVRRQSTLKPASALQEQRPTGPPETREFSCWIQPQAVR